MSLAFLVTAPGLVQGALLMREMKFRSLELRTVVAMVASAAVAITLAALGVGPWAIVGQTITMPTVSTILLWRSSTWRPRLLFSWRSLRDAAGFGSHVLGSRLVGWANANVDNLLVGRFLGASPLGAYSLAFAVALTPVNRIGIPVTTVFFPAFSKIQDRERIAEVWLRAIRVLAFLVVPGVLGLVVVAPDLVRVVFGLKWRHAAPVMQVLALVALTQTLTSLNDGILQALDRTRLLFRFRTLLSVVTLAAFAGGLPWGITGASFGYLIASLVLQPVYVWLVARVVGITLVAWLRSVVVVFELGAIMMVSVYTIRRLLLAAHTPAGVRLVVLVLAGTLIYGALALWQESELGVDVRGFRQRISRFALGRLR
jgi:O-antigen/teichoic acid export membrane protein